MTQEFSADGMEGVAFVSRIESFVARCSDWQRRLLAEASPEEISHSEQAIPGFAVRI
jgi:hypothetical protein